MVRARAAGCGGFMVRCGELLVGVSVLSCELVVVRGGRARPCSWARWSRFYTCLAGTAPRGVRFPSHGIGLVIALRGGGRAVPPERHRRAWDRRDGALSRAGEPETFFSSCMPGVNLSPDSNNIFSQPQKTPHNARTNEPARVDAPGRAIFQSITRRRDRASARSACPKSNSGLHFGFGASDFAAGLVPG